MQYVFVGGLFPNHDITKKLLSNEKSNIQNAADLLQWSLIQGIQQNRPGKLRVINAIYCGAYPLRHKTFRIPEFHFSHDGISNDINCSFINFTGLKHYFRWKAIKTNLMNFCTSHFKGKDAQPVTVIIYAMHSPFLLAVAQVKKYFPINILLICPDLPDYMNTSSHTGLLYRLFKFLDTWILRSTIHYVDSFVFLTQAMNRRVNLLQKPYVVMEGIANSENMTLYPESTSTDGLVRFAYAGTLNSKYGINILLNAFRLCPEEHFRLLICGHGDSIDSIKKHAEEDKRVKFYGLMEQSDVFRLMQQADILINPRQNSEEYTKYSFPSKLMEYLLAAKPVIAYQLDGFPSEYDDYLIYPPDDRVETLADIIRQVSNKPIKERVEIGRRNRLFVQTHKNAQIQTLRIINLMDHC